MWKNVIYFMPLVFWCLFQERHVLLTFLSADPYQMYSPCFIQEKHDILRQEWFQFSTSSKKLAPKNDLISSVSKEKRNKIGKFLQKMGKKWWIFIWEHVQDSDVQKEKVLLAESSYWYFHNRRHGKHKRCKFNFEQKAPSVSYRNSMENKEYTYFTRISFNVNR